MKQTEAQLLLEHHLDELGLVPWEREYRFHLARKWRFDYVITGWMLAIEIEGGVFPFRDKHGVMTVGGHLRGKHYQSDLDKYNEATIQGWRLLRFSVEDIKKGRDIDTLKRWKSVNQAFWKYA